MATPAVAPSMTAAFLSTVADQARASGAFAEVALEGTRARCVDPVQPDASYCIALEDARLWVSWVSPNRYLSQSIEAEVRWTGDDIDELIDEEVAAQGWTGKPVGRFQHFRSEDKLFTFRSELPLNAADAGERHASEAVKFLLAYQAAFRNLGDMKPDEEE